MPVSVRIYLNPECDVTPTWGEVYIKFGVR